MSEKLLKQFFEISDMIRNNALLLFRKSDVKPEDYNDLTRALYEYKLALRKLKIENLER